MHGLANSSITTSRFRERRFGNQSGLDSPTIGNMVSSARTAQNEDASASSASEASLSEFGCEFGTSSRDEFAGRVRSPSLGAPSLGTGAEFGASLGTGKVWRDASVEIHSASLGTGKVWRARVWGQAKCGEKLALKFKRNMACPRSPPRERAWCTSAHFLFPQQR
jgi:hypothetical protein